MGEEEIVEGDEEEEEGEVVDAEVIMIGIGDINQTEIEIDDIMTRINNMKKSNNNHKKRMVNMVMMRRRNHRQILIGDREIVDEVEGVEEVVVVEIDDRISLNMFERIGMRMAMKTIKTQVKHHNNRNPMRKNKRSDEERRRRINNRIQMNKIIMKKYNSNHKNNNNR